MKRDVDVTRRELPRQLLKFGIMAYATLLMTHMTGMCVIIIHKNFGMIHNQKINLYNFWAGTRPAPTKRFL